MKILFVAEKYPPTVGGGETHIHQLAEGLAQEGQAVTVVTQTVAPTSDRDRYRTGAVSVREIDGLTLACQGLDCKVAIESLYKELIRSDADVVHIFNYVPALLISWLREAVPGKLIVSLFETHVPGTRVFELYKNYDLERVLQRSLVKTLRPDLHICGSKAYERWAREAGFTERISVVEFGTDLKQFSDITSLREPARRKLGIERSFAFLVPARPIPRKRIEDAIVAISKLAESLPQVQLLLTAPTDRSPEVYVESLMTLAKSLGVDMRVKWLTGLSWEEMPAVYAACDAMILPSSHEGWGIALTEAMAARRPVITTDVEGHDEIIEHGQTGLLYPAGDVDALVKAMKTVVTEDVSDMIAKASEQAWARFARESVVKHHLACYEDLVARK